MRLTRQRSAFSIIELMIAVIIISILSAMVILVASQRAAEARLRSAQADLRMIAQAEQSALTDIGYFLRLYVLDDVVGGDGITPGALNDVIDGLQDERNNARNIEGARYGIVPDMGSLPGAPSAAAPGSLVNITALLRNETLIGVGLPYISYPRQYTDLPSGTNFNVPRDPWGNPYVLLTRQGFINDVETLFSEPGGGAASAILEFVRVIDSGLTFDARVFDRLTILSFGPNALPGDGAGSRVGTDDDIFLQLN